MRRRRSKRDGEDGRRREENTMRPPSDGEGGER